MTDLEASTTTGIGLGRSDVDLKASPFRVSSDWQRRALEVMPGGVNSPVRAFKAVGGSPPFIDSGRGSILKTV